MPPSTPRAARVTLSARFLVAGLVGTVLLAASTIGLPLRELTRIEHTALEIADDGPEAAYYLGELGQQLARLRFHALVLASPEDAARMEDHLQAAFDRLPGALDAPSRQRWAALAPEVLRLRRIYKDAAALTRAGQQARAEKILAAESAAATHLDDALDDLDDLHRESVLARLRAASHQASRTGLLELVLLGVFLVGLIAIWIVMLGILRRQGRRLAEHTARLESANEDLDAFASRVAHDLKNALGPIVMAPAMLRQAPGDTAMVLKTADRTERGSLRAVAIVDALLAFSRASQSAEADEASALEPVVRNVAEEVAPLVARLGATLETGELPEVRLRCSAGLLHIVLANLCGNAVKFLEGRPERRVRVSARLDGAGCQILVEDTGPGIPKEALGRIFEPFFRVPGGRVPGSGIGLATVRRIVDARGGRIEIESEVGRGSLVRLWLPAAPAGAAPAAAGATARQR